MISDASPHTSSSRATRMSEGDEKRDEQRDSEGPAADVGAAAC